MKRGQESKKIFSVGAAASIMAAVLMSYALYAMWRATPGTSGYRAAQEQARTSVADWPQASRVTANLMIEKYGAPEYQASDYLLWGRAGPWKRTVVRKTYGWNTLEQAVDFELTAVEAGKVAAIGHGLRADPARDEIVAASGSEELNYLAANMADEVIMGQRTPQEASAFFLKTVTLAASGKSSAYTEGLLFTPAPPAPRPMYGRGLVY